MARGFILQPTYRIESGRPVVLLYGKLESGESFLVRDARETPHFWIACRDAGRARALAARVIEERAPRATLRGEPVARVEVVRPQDVPGLRDELARAGVATYEADVRFANRYLIDRGIRGSLEIRGPSRPGEGVAAVFENPVTEPADWTPELSLLSLDIETDPRASRLLSISLVGCGASEVLLLTPEGYSCPAGATACASERDLLASLVRRVLELDPDAITGWNVVDFDLAVLTRSAERLGVPLALGRGPGTVRLRAGALGRGPSQAIVPGRIVLDGIQLVRGAFVALESHALESVARKVLGKGKIITGPDRAEAILEAFEQDRARLVDYNRNDSQLVLEILERLHLVELAVERSRLTGMPLDRVAASIASFDFLYLSELSRRRIVAPTADPGQARAVPTSGGHVLRPSPGLHRNVLVLDFKSLYPSIIRTFQIDPLGHLPSPDPSEDPIVAPNGAAFRRTPGILPGILDELFPRREAARSAGDPVAAQAIKILMNSFYGVLGAPSCRFADPALANAITSFGREILLWSKAWIETRGHEVLYGDTDSLFVSARLGDSDAARELGGRLATELNRELASHVRSTWRVESRLELQFERLYLRLFLPPVRHGTAGARKRYVGLVQEGGEQEVVFTGMEVVRRDWTELARRVQRELYHRLFTDRPVEDYLRDVVADLRAGGLDDQLVYRKSLRKALSAYTASTPPHVAAARKMTSRSGSTIAFVMTVHGPEPALERRSALDHEHYVQRQVRAVAEPVLALRGLHFDRVIGDDAQLTLF